MHTRTDENYNRGYEWWMMEQAKLRRPDILLAALPWGVPGWADGGKTYFSLDLIDYMIKWLQARSIGSSPGHRCGRGPE